MQLLKIAIITILAGGTLFASAATFSKMGAKNVEHPAGITLRQESVRTGHSGFFPYYSRRHSHRGGGLSGGK